MRGARKIDNGKRGSHAEGHLPHLLFPRYENRKIERRVRERYQKINGKNEGWHANQAEVFLKLSV